MTMREDVVTPATARRLRQAGLPWDPQPGDWCAVLGGEYIGESQAGLWLVAAMAPSAGLLGVMDPSGQWPMARVPVHECVWIPSVGKLKMWLRARGYRVATRETDPIALGSGLRHVCRLMRAGDPPVEGEGPSEAEAVADVIFRVLAQSAGTDVTPSTDVTATHAGWLALPDTPTRRL